MAMQQEKRDRLQGTGGNCRPPLIQGTSRKSRRSRGRQAEEDRGEMNTSSDRYKQEKQEKRDWLQGTGRKLATSTERRYKQEKEGEGNRSMRRETDCRGQEEIIHHHRYKVKGREAGKAGEGRIIRRREKRAGGN